VYVRTRLGEGEYHSESLCSKSRGLPQGCVAAEIRIVRGIVSSSSDREGQQFIEYFTRFEISLVRFDD